MSHLQRTYKKVYFPANTLAAYRYVGYRKRALKGNVGGVSVPEHLLASTAVRLHTDVGGEHRVTVPAGGPLRVSGRSPQFGLR